MKQWDCLLEQHSNNILTIRYILSEERDNIHSTTKGSDYREN